MNALRIPLLLFPPPRRRVTVRSVVPLVIFLAAIGAVALGLERTGVVRFANPAAFGWLAVTPYIWWLHMAGVGALLRRRALAALLLRLLVAGLFVLLLAQPHAVRKSDRLAVVYALDMSDSVGEPTVERALHYVLTTAAGKPSQDEAGLVVFGRDAGVELPPRSVFPFETLNLRIARDGTNLEQGLSLAAALCPDDQPARIVLITDGVETEGNAAGLLPELKARGLPVDVLPIHYDFPHEVWMERLDLPRQVKHGETYEASVLLSALRPGQGKLVLRENGQVVFAESVEFQAGKNRFRLPIYRRESGYYEYAATIELPEGMDGRPENNSAINSLYLEGKGKVLVVLDPSAEPRDWRPLVTAMRRAEREVEVKSAFDFPGTAEALLPYHAVFFVDVPADEFPPAHLVALRDAVFNFGTGFCMVGGRNSFGAGGYRLTPVEEILPVSMDVPQRKVLPKGALVIVLHTCEFDAGNTHAKRITKAAIKVLSSRDEVGVLISDYQGDDGWVFPLTPAGEYGKLVRLINAAAPGDMMDFSPAMRKGLAALAASDAAAKHMIIISDGDPSPPPPPLVKKFADAGISISTVAIQPHNPRGPEITLMKRLAAATGGRFYRTDNPSILPRIFIKEAKTLRTALIQNRTFTPNAAFPSPILKGIRDLPPLHGFVLSTPKARAELVLRTPDPDVVEPVLATWRHGLGKTAAFTSDLATNWGRDWVAWPHYQAFVNQLLAEVSRGKRRSDLEIRAGAAGARGVVEVEYRGQAPAVAAIPTAAVRDPGGQVEPLRLARVGPGRYRGMFPLNARGRYQIVVGTGTGEDRDQALASLVVPYSAEYMRFRADPIMLEKIVRATGGRRLTGREAPEELYTEERDVRSKNRSIFDWFLVLLATLIPLDVALRRVQINVASVLRRLGLARGTSSSGETLGGLLKRKEELGIPAAHEPDRATPAARPSGPDLPPRPDSPARPDPPTSPPAAPADDGTDTPLSTTERLLELKRRRKKDDTES